MLCVKRLFTLPSHFDLEVLGLFSPRLPNLVRLQQSSASPTTGRAASDHRRKRHPDYLVGEFVDYYNNHRSHTERDWLPPIREEPDEVDSLKLDQVEVKSYVGGLVKSFERKAA